MKKHINISDKGVIQKMEKLKEFYEIDKESKLLEHLINNDYTRVFKEEKKPAATVSGVSLPELPLYNQKQEQKQDPPKREPLTAEEVFA